MGFIADFINRFADTIEEFAKILVDPLGLVTQREDLPDEDASRNRADQLVDSLVGGVFDQFEDEVLEPFDAEGELTPDNIEQLVDEAEGNALQLGLAAVSTNTALEIAGGTQLETHEEAITQLATFLALEDMLGIRSQMVAEKGVQPALEARVAKETRSEFVNLQDAVEYLLRNKTADEGWIEGTNTRGNARDIVGSNEPVNPDNPLEEWGIRDDQLQILEEVSLDAVEIEELIESPVQFGVVPGEEATEEVLRISGLPESVKELFRETIESAPRAADLWEQRTTTGDLVTELDTLVNDEELTPDEALALLPDEIDEARPALRDRWRLFQQLPEGSPTRSLIESSFARGYTDLDTLRERLNRLEYDTEEYDDVLRTTVLDELDGDLQEAVGLGLVSEAEYADLAAFAGVDDQAIDKLLRGQSFSDIATERLKETADPADLSVRTLSGVGESRGAGLRAAGIETVGDMASADVETVADAAQVSRETAQQFIDQAQARVT